MTLAQAEEIRDRAERLSSTKKLLTPKEAAELLSVRVQTLAVWRQTGRYKIPYVKIGTSVRYRLTDIERWLDSRTVTPIATHE